MDVRRAGPADAAAIAEVHVRAWQETYAGQLPASFLATLSVDVRSAVWEQLLSGAERPDVLVAHEDGTIVAFVVVGPSRDEGVDVAVVGEVVAIYARRRVWGTGVGRRLMENGLHLMREAGFAEAMLWVLDTNARARRFYEAGEWHHDGAIKNITIGGTVVREVRYRRGLEPAGG